MFDTNPNGLIQSFNPMAGFQLPAWGASPNTLGSGIPDVATHTPALPMVGDTVGGGGGGLFSSFLQQRDANGVLSGGWGTTALGAAQGLGNLYMGMQQYGLAKKALQQSKDQFEKNYAAQRTTTNASLEDRQRARVASNPGAYQSVGDYMNQHGIR